MAEEDLLRRGEPRDCEADPGVAWAATRGLCERPFLAAEAIWPYGRGWSGSNTDGFLDLLEETLYRISLWRMGRWAPCEACEACIPGWTAFCGWPIWPTATGGCP